MFAQSFSISDAAVASVPNIIKEAAGSPLGIIALLILVLGALALAFFRGAKESFRLAVFLAMFAGVSAFSVQLLAVQREISARVLQDSLEITRDQFRQRIDELRVKLRFPKNVRVTGDRAVVRSYLQKRNDSTSSLIDRSQIMQFSSDEGLSIQYSGLPIGSRFWVEVDDRGKHWRSPDVKIPEGDLAMSLRP